jgi:hypothetical protein
VSDKTEALAIIRGAIIELRGRNGVFVCGLSNKSIGGSDLNPPGW